MVKTLREKRHLKCVSYTLRLIRDKFFDIPCLIEKKLDAFIAAETKLDFPIPERQFLPEEWGNRIG